MQTNSQMTNDLRPLTFGSQQLNDNTVSYLINQNNIMNWALAAAENKIADLEAKVKNIFLQLDKDADKSITPTAYSKLIHVAPSTVINWIRSGLISKDAYELFGNRYRIFPRIFNEELKLKKRFINLED